MASTPDCKAFVPPAKRQKRKLGQFLMDVLNITYLGNDQIKPEKQLGTIKLVSGRGLQHLYNVEHVDTRKPSIKYGDAIPLTVKGPTPFFYDDFVYLDFDLFCGTFKGVQDLEWEPCSREVSRQRVLFQSVDGTGWILVNIGRFSGASITCTITSLVSELAENLIFFQRRLQSCYCVWFSPHVVSGAWPSLCALCLAIWATISTLYYIY